MKEYKNPHVQVVWEDYPENFTQDKIKNIKLYFQKKYKTTNVNLITKAKFENINTNNIDVSINIMDKNYQLELIKEYLESKSLLDYVDELNNIDNIVNSQLDAIDTLVFKKWYIRNIEFSNFLSYGDNQKLNFDELNGICVIESNPPNFGGKTILGVDLLLFLFFNETTRTTKIEEIFNKFTDKKEVYVKGEITIDGEDYIIERIIQKKKKSIKSELNFYKKLSDGSLINYTGEQRRETEQFIKNSIGSKDDFLMTILTTSTNLEELIDSKPTARGQVLSRFLGLDFLKRKEEIAKQLYNSFSKSMLSNIYSSQQLIDDNETYLANIENLKNNIIVKNYELLEVKDRIIKGQEYRDKLLNNKHTDIDREISQIQPKKIESEINTLLNQKKINENFLSKVNVVEPSKFYSEEEHDAIKDEYNKLYPIKVNYDLRIKNINELKSSVNNGIKCEHCGIELITASITSEKIKELDNLISEKNKIEEQIKTVLERDSEYNKIKKEFDEYEKNKLIKEKYEITIEGINLKISAQEDKLKRYNELQDKIITNEKIETQLIKANIRLNELNSQQNLIIRNIESFNNEIKQYENKIDENKKKIAKILEETEKEKIYKIYLEIYGKNGISKNIMKTMMPLINSELQRLLEDSCYFRVEIRINEKNEVDFVMIDNNSGVEKSMTSGSGYERTIASLALRSVLSKVCSLPKPNVIVMDEIFGKISNENLELVGEFFSKIKNYFEKIIVISHNPLINNWADKIIKVTKTDNISTVNV